MKFDRDDIPYRFLRNWKSYRCCGRGVINLQLYDTPLFKRMLPRKYGVVITFQGDYQIRFGPELSEEDAKWTLRKELELKTSERVKELLGRKDVISVKRVPYNRIPETRITKQIIREELEKIRSFDFIPKIKEVVDWDDDDWGDDEDAYEPKIQLERDFKSIIEENKEEVRNSLPEEMQRFADILDED